MRQKEGKSVAKLRGMIFEQTHRQGHTLDHVYANTSQIDLDCSVLKETFGIVTDHFPCLSKLSAIERKQELGEYSYRKLKIIVKTIHKRSDSYKMFSLVETKNYYQNTKSHLARRRILIEIVFMSLMIVIRTLYSTRNALLVKESTATMAIE